MKPECEFGLDRDPRGEKQKYKQIFLALKRITKKQSLFNRVLSALLMAFP